MENFDPNKAREYVLNSGKHLFIATDLLSQQGDTYASTRSRGYRAAKRVLDTLEKDGFLHSRFFPSVRLDVFWKIP